MSLNVSYALDSLYFILGRGRIIFRNYIGSTVKSNNAAVLPTSQGSDPLPAQGVDTVTFKVWENALTAHVE